jgi:uncharacterized protein (DUF2062 family)
MIHVTRKLVRRWLDSLLHIDDSPERTAAAFAIGVFFGFSPFLGLHTILGLALAFLLNLNRVAVILGVYSNLPWIIAPYYTFATLGGAALLRTRFPDSFGRELARLFELSVFSQAFWSRLIELIRPIWWPYFVGSALGAILLAAIAYPVALAFITSRRRLTQMMHKTQ